MRAEKRLTHSKYSLASREQIKTMAKNAREGLENRPRKAQSHAIKQVLLRSSWKTSSSHQKDRGDSVAGLFQK